MSTRISPLAGKPAPASVLIGVAKLVAAYFSERRCPTVASQRCGAHGAGNFVKMVHTGIEYGVMAAYAKGLDARSRCDPEAADALIAAGGAWHRHNPAPQKEHEPCA